MTVGTVLRSHAGGYLVYQPRLGVSLQCQARGRLKKERVSILTGDRVELEDLDLDKRTAVITACLKRWSLLSRPLIANVDQVVIVQAVRQPEWNQLWCDRYIVHFQLELPGIMPVLCFNKCDLVDTSQAETLRRTYESLGYRVVLVSAVTGLGVAELKQLIDGRITVFAGPSGVGKSSLLNTLEPTLNLKIGVMDHDFGVGRHTTTYSELYRVGGAGDEPVAEGAVSSGSSRAVSLHSESAGSLMVHDESEEVPTWVADTPGFNLSELRHPEPLEVMHQFPEITMLAEGCRFSDCLHLVEMGCNVIASLSEEPGDDDNDDDEFEDGETAEEEETAEDSGDTGTDPVETPEAEADSVVVSTARYQSYVTLVAEAQEEYNARKESSQKVEASVKRVGGDGSKGKFIPRLNSRYRSASRRREKQKLSGTAVYDEELDEELEGEDPELLES